MRSTSKGSDSVRNDIIRRTLRQRGNAAVWMLGVALLLLAIGVVVVQYTIGQGADLATPSQTQTSVASPEGSLSPPDPTLVRTSGESPFSTPEPVVRSPEPVQKEPPDAGKTPPHEVVVPTIDGQPATEEQTQMLRMLVAAMALADLPTAVPADLSSHTWALLMSWIEPLLAERREMEAQAQKEVTAEVRARLASGHYEVSTMAPSKWPEDVYVGWRQVVDDRGRSIYKIVRILPGGLPRVDFLRQQTSSIDRDMATLARSLFDQSSK